MRFSDLDLICKSFFFCLECSKKYISIVFRHFVDIAGCTHEKDVSLGFTARGECVGTKIPEESANNSSLRNLPLHMTR